MAQAVNITMKRNVTPRICSGKYVRLFQRNLLLPLSQNCDFSKTSVRIYQTKRRHILLDG